MNIRHLLSFNDLFPNEKPLSISHYLDGIDRLVLIKIALLFIHVKNYTEARSYASTFVKGDNYKFYEYILNRIEILTNSNSKQNYFIGSSVAGLKLLQYIFSIPPLNETIISEAEIVTNMTKAMVLINQNSISDLNFDNRGINQDSILNSIHNDGGTSNFILGKKIFCNQIVYSDFINYPLENLALVQMLKADKFFKFSNLDLRFKALVKKFLKEYECPNAREYQKVIIRLIGFVFESSKSPGYPIIKIPSDETLDINLLINISLDKGDVLPMANNYDSLEFRNKPLIRIREDEFCIINKSFLIERLYNSIKFNLNKINTSLDSDTSKRILRDVFANYTTLFSEGFLFNKTIENIYRKYSYNLVAGGTGRCDYFVRSNEKIFLFECKDIEYASKIKQSDKFSDIKEYIWEKLVSKDGRPIGAGQIIRDIKEISDGTTKWERNLPKDLQIFPILVLGKPIYSTLGFNYILNYWFEEELAKEKISGRIRIRPLLVVDIDTLLLLEGSLTSKQLNLETEIENYYNYINRNFSIKQKYLSFSSYINSERSRYIFSKKSMALFGNTLRSSLFGIKREGWWCILPGCFLLTYFRRIGQLLREFIYK